MRELNRGILIAIEGIDGAGKTTQVRILSETLARAGLSVVTLKEPTDGQWGQKIRTLATKGRNLSPRDEMLLFLNDRLEDVERNIRPSLAERKIVLMDRYYLSNIAYQGAIGLDTTEIRTTNEKFAPVPDLVLILDVAPSIGQSRLVNGRKETPNHFESEEYLEKVRREFQRMQHHKNVQVIDGSRPIWDVAESVANSVHSIIKAVGEVDGSEVVEAYPGIAGT
jgi:dTMP kinase